LRLERVRLRRHPLLKLRLLLRLMLARLKLLLRKEGLAENGCRRPDQAASLSRLLTL
jgi:hypothetical protein